MENGVCGHHGLLVLFHVAGATEKEKGFAIILFQDSEDNSVLETTAKKKYAIPIHVQWMVDTANGLTGLHVL